MWHKISNIYKKAIKNDCKIKKQLKIIAKQKSLQQNVTITEDEEIYKKLSLVYREDNNLKWILMIFYVC